MRITNNHGLHPALVAGIEAARGQYDPGKSDITVTQLLDPPQVVHLKRTHGDEIEEDASGLVYAVEGTVIHSLIQAGAESLEDPNLIMEQRVYVERLGLKVGGQFDMLDCATLWDWKYLSAYEAKTGPKKNREQQLNLLAHMIREDMGVPVEALKIGAIVRDWRPAESRREAPKYPGHRCPTFDVKLWSSEECEAFLLERLEIHKAALDGDVAECSASERWLRNGRPVRCIDYCAASSVCPQHAAHLNPQA